MAMTILELPGYRPSVPPAKDGSALGAAERTLERLGACPVRSDSLRMVLGMFAYFLVLGSIAVVTLTGQFPWFTLGPAAVLGVIAHCRRLDAKWERKKAKAAGTVSSHPRPRL
jgi:hypothetical protein